MSSDEEPGESVVNEAQHAAGYPEASSSQSSPVSTPSGHQSSSATSLESEEITLARLRKELALKDEVTSSPRVRSRSRLMHFVQSRLASSEAGWDILRPSECPTMPNLLGNAMATLFVSSLVYVCGGGMLTPAP